MTMLTMTILTMARWGSPTYYDSTYYYSTYHYTYHAHTYYDEVGLSNYNITDAESIADAAQKLGKDLSSCGFSCVLKFFIDAIFSTPTLLVISVLLCITLNFSRSRLKQLKQKLDRSEELRAEEHADKVRLLRYNGVQL